MRKKIVIANLKTHYNVSEASLYLHKLEKVLVPHRKVEVVVAPSLVCLQPLSLQIDRRKIKLAAQNAFYEDQGAYTGEVSMSMLEGLVDYVIIGHSERRIYFHEDNQIVANKVKAAIRNGLTPILCVGENITERQTGIARRIIHDQLTSALSNLTSPEISQVIIAYEPIWAISTFGNQQADPLEVKKMINEIRNQIDQMYGKEIMENVMVLYGGSVSTDNVGNYLALDFCDGCLVGGASLDPINFNLIAQKAFYSQEINSVSPYRE